MNDAFQLLHLMSAKICHDIAAPLNAMSLGMEMLADNQKVDGSTREILNSSVHLMSLKLRIYRLFMTSHLEGPSFLEAKTLLIPYFKSKNIEAIFEEKLDHLPESIKSRILLGLSYMAADSLARGGKIIFTMDAASMITLHVVGASAQLRQGYQEILMQHSFEEAPSARTIFPYYLKLLSIKGNTQLNVNVVSNQEYFLTLL